MNQDIAERVTRLERENRLTKLVGLSAVVTRVKRLERENRFIKVAGLSALAAALIFLLLGRDHQREYLDVIKARSFQVVDKNLEIRAELSYWPEHGLEHIESLKKELEDPSVDQRPRYKELLLKWIEESESEDPSLFGLRIHGAEGAGSASLVGTMHSAPVLMVFGEEGLSALHPAALHLSSSGNGQIDLAIDESVSLRLSRWDGPGSIWLFLTEESSSLSIRSEGILQDRAVLEVHNQKTSQTGEVTEPPPPSLSFFDEEGDVIWEAP